MGSGHLAGCVSLNKISGSAVELEGIGPSAGRFTVRRHHQISPVHLSVACVRRGVPVTVKPRRAFSFLGDAFRRHAPPRYLLINKNRRSPLKAIRGMVRREAQDCGGKSGIPRIRLSNLRAGYVIEGQRGNAAAPNFTPASLIHPQKGVGAGRSAGFLGGFLGRGFDGLVGDADHVGENGVHPRVGIARPGLGWFLHGPSLRKQASTCSRKSNVAHYHPGSCASRLCDDAMIRARHLETRLTGRLAWLASETRPGGNVTGKL
jgi:hypothetical protein